MEQEPEEGGAKASDGILRYIFRRMYRVRPASLYLLLALFIALPLGTQMIHAREDPRRLAFYVTLHLILLFVVLVRAVFDMAEIARDHLKEREHLYQATLGDRDFARELGERVSKHRDEQ